MKKDKPKSQAQRTAKHKEENPEDEARRKASERQRKNLLRFHIRRKVLSKIDIPDSVDQTTPDFKQAWDSYLGEIDQPTEVKER